LEQDPALVGIIEIGIPLGRPHCIFVCKLKSGRKQFLLELKMDQCTKPSSELLILSQVEQGADVDLQERDIDTVKPERLPLPMKLRTEDSLAMVTSKFVSMFSSDFNKQVTTRRICRSKENNFDKKRLQRRQNVQSLLISTTLSPEEIALRTGVSVTTVQRVRTQLRILGDKQKAFHQSRHNQDELRRLDVSITSEKHKYFSSASHKRLLPQFSRHFICRRFKLLGFCYRKIKHTRSKQKSWTSLQNLALIGIVKELMVATMQEGNLIFVDQIKLVLRQTPSHIWRRQNQEEEYDGRPDKLIIISNIACNFRGYYAVQFLLDEMKAEDFLFFGTQLIKSFNPDTPVALFLDNAAWQKNNKVRACYINEYLHYNLPGVPMNNFIEGTFSGTRSDWRRRCNNESLNDELRSVIGILKAEVQKDRFVGYSRNWRKWLVELASTLTE